MVQDKPLITVLLQLIQIKRRPKSGRDRFTKKTWYFIMTF